MTTVLRYTGDEEGVPFVMGVPARNLTEDDLTSLVGRHGDDRGAVKRALVKSGLYSAVSHPKDAASSAADSKADKE